MNLQFAWDLNVLALRMPAAAWYRYQLVCRRLGGMGVPGPRGQRDFIWVQFPALPGVLKAVLKEFPQAEVAASVHEWLEFAMESQRRRVLARQIADVPIDWATNGYPRIPPYQYQVTGVPWLAWSLGALLCDKMGLGKTMQVINAASWSFLNKPELGQRVVVVCPKNAFEQWQEQLDMWGWGKRRLDPMVRSICPQGPTRERREEIERWASDGWKQARWLILNYEALRFFEQAFWTACTDSILVLDEIHRAKSEGALQSTAIRKARARRRWGLTGTPIPNVFEDIWHIAHILQPGTLYWTNETFLHHHVSRSGRYNQEVRYKDVKRAKDLIETFAVGRRAEDCHDMPRLERVTRHVDLAPEEWKAYCMMRDELRAWYDAEAAEGEITTAEAKNFATRILRLRQIAAGLVSESADGIQSFSRSITKIKEVYEAWVDTGRERMIVWVIYKPIGKRIRDLFEEKGVPTAYLDGDSSEKKRSEAKRAYRETEGFVLVCQMNAMGESWDGQAGRVQVLVDVPWTPKEFEQCTHRQRRPGQEADAILVIEVLARKTVDIPLRRRLQTKMDHAAEIPEKAFRRRVETGAVLRKWLG